MGLIPAIREWFRKPLTPNVSITNLTIYVGLIMLLAWLWSSVILGLKRGLEFVE
jgi:hypothetical protein